MAELAFVLRLALGVLFFASAIGKLWSVRQFASTVNRVASMFVASVGRRAVLGGVAMTVGTELFLAIAFISGQVPIVAGVVAITLLVLFAVVALVAIRHAASIDCHCFGTSGEELGARTLARALLLLAAASAYLGTAATRSNGWTPTSGEEWVAAFALAAGVLNLLAWLTNIDVPLRLVTERRLELKEIARNTTPTSGPDLDSSH